MITRNNIIDTYLFLRKENQSIPDETLDFILNAALARLELINSIKNNSHHPTEIKAAEGL